MAVSVEADRACDGECARACACTCSWPLEPQVAAAAKSCATLRHTCAASLRLGGHALAHRHAEDRMESMCASTRAATAALPKRGSRNSTSSYTDGGSSCSGALGPKSTAGPWPCAEQTARRTTEQLSPTRSTTTSVELNRHSRRVQLPQSSTLCLVSTRSAIEMAPQPPHRATPLLPPLPFSPPLVQPSHHLCLQTQQCRRSK